MRGGWRTIQAGSKREAFSNVTIHSQWHSSSASSIQYYMLVLWTQCITEINISYLKAVQTRSRNIYTNFYSLVKAVHSIKTSGLQMVETLLIKDNNRNINFCQRYRQQIELQMWKLLITIKSTTLRFISKYGYKFYIQFTLHLCHNYCGIQLSH